MSQADTLHALAHPLVALLIALALYGTWRILARPRQMLFFCGAFFCYGMGLLPQILLWPANLVANVALTGVIYGAAAYLFARGVVEQEGQRLPGWPAALILSTMLGLRIWGAFDLDAFLLRTASLYGAVTLLFLMALWQIRHLTHGSTLERVLFWFVFIGTLVQLPRVLLTASARTAAYGYDGALYWVGTHVSFYVFSVGTALLFLLLTALRAIASYTRAAESDLLTGIPNRAGLQRFLHKHQRRHARYGLAMLDADHFKDVNDRYGHPSGDAVLKEMAGVLMRQVRGSDLLGRFGGEEFMLILPGAGLAETGAVAERMRAAVAGHDFSRIVPGLRCTVSVGVGSFPMDLPFDKAYALVDLNLAEAKRQGRNTVASTAGA